MTEFDKGLMKANNQIDDSQQVKFISKLYTNALKNGFSGYCSTGEKTSKSRIEYDGKFRKNNFFF